MSRSLNRVSSPETNVFKRLSTLDRYLPLWTPRCEDLQLKMPDAVNYQLSEFKPFSSNPEITLILMTSYGFAQLLCSKLKY